VKLRTSNFVCIFTGLIGLSEQKSIKNVGKSSCGRRQGLSKIFRAAIYRAHRAVVFAIARLSCLQTNYFLFEKIKFQNFTRVEFLTILYGRSVVFITNVLFNCVKRITLSSFTLAMY